MSETSPSYSGTSWCLEKRKPLVLDTFLATPWMPRHPKVRVYLLDAALHDRLMMESCIISFSNALIFRRWQRDLMFWAPVYPKLIPGIFIPAPTKGLIQRTMVSKFEGVCHLYKHSHNQFAFTNHVYNFTIQIGKWRVGITTSYATTTPWTNKSQRWITSHVRFIWAN